jgi:hypothetical protein
MLKLTDSNKMTAFFEYLPGHSAMPRVTELVTITVSGPDNSSKQITLRAKQVEELRRWLG